MARTKNATAKQIKKLLWETAQDLRDNKIEPARANAIATQGKVLLATIKVEISLKQNRKIITKYLKDFHR